MIPLKTLPNQKFNLPVNTAYVAMGIIFASLLLRLFCMDQLPLLVEEAYYWNYANHLDFGYLDHPPMVALLIKASTSLLGTSEFGVRFLNLVCWGTMVFYSCRFTRLINPTPLLYPILFLSILPFFLINSVIITPDTPLLTCCSALLYSIYRAVVQKESHYWYVAGLWLGLGMLSKYSISLFALAAFFYLLLDKSSRFWFKRKEPYLGACLAALVFSPVIYWNATHGWCSFIFQSSRRFQENHHFNLHAYLGFLLLFFMPIGMKCLYALFKSETKSTIALAPQKRLFLQVFTGVPLVFFGLFSLSHSVRLNWITPAVLPIIPILSAYLQQSLQSSRYVIRHESFITAIAIGFAFIVIVSMLISGYPEKIYRTAFSKEIAWGKLAHDFYGLAEKIEKQSSKKPIFVGVDKYNINSELWFYQHMLHEKHQIEQEYPIVGSHIFGQSDLMYSFWQPELNLEQSQLIAIAMSKEELMGLTLASKPLMDTPINTIWAYSINQKIPIKPFYYKEIRPLSPSTLLTEK